ncbi:MAG TPA: hypothetical protein VI306_17185 [Pyrinomonadaceae bacterium]
MTIHHLSTSELEQFCVGSLPDNEHADIAVHTASCRVCHQRFVDELSTSPATGFSLEPEFWFRNDHLDFESIVALIGNTLDPVLEEIHNIHLKTCESCREDIRYFEAFRQTTARELNGSYDRGLANDFTPAGFGFFGTYRRPAYAIAAIVILALSIVAIVSYKRRELPRPQQYVYNAPEPPPAPIVANDQPVLINDARGEIAIYKDGRVTGLDELSEDTRQQIAQVVLTEQVEPAAVLKDLAAQRNGLRGGPGLDKQVKLVYPTRRVVIEDQPIFSWTKLPEADSYQVYVIDAHGNEVARSDALPAAQTRWRVSKHLRRGQTFSWVVAAIVDGKEMISPSASEPEMKFAILSSAYLQELSRLKKQESHLALGLFYAKTGLIGNAEREFQILVATNPQSELAKRLLQSVRRTS